MGGNAIKKLGIMSTRVNREIYEQIKSDIERYLQSNDTVVQHATFKTFSEKSDFGDIDILIQLENPEKRVKFEDAFNGICNDDELYSVKNGPVTSFAYKMSDGQYFQIDLNYVSTEREFEIANMYHGNGDLGNLIGRIAHNMGLKFGHDGLWYIHRNETYVVGEILLSENIDNILLFLGYDPMRFHAGFTTNEAVWEYATSSPFYHPAFYALENRAYSSKVRDRKRPSYTGFLDYISKRPETGKAPIVSKDYSIVAIEWFAKFGEYTDLIQKESRRLRMKAILDVDWVCSVSGISRKDGKKLGELMQHLKKTVPIYGLPDIVSTREMVYRNIIQAYIEERKNV
jgi:hypothetical protein